MIQQIASEAGVKLNGTSGDVEWQRVDSYRAPTTLPHSTQHTSQGEHVSVAADGSIYVAGEAQILKLNVSAPSSWVSPSCALPSAQVGQSCSCRYVWRTGEANPYKTELRCSA